MLSKKQLVRKVSERGTVIKETARVCQTAGREARVSLGREEPVSED